MKKNISLILSILISVSFMFTRIRYANEKPVFMFSALLKIVASLLHYAIAWLNSNYLLNFPMRLIEILVLISCLVLSAIFKKIILNSIFCVLFIAYLIFISLNYRSIMDLEVYLISSIPCYILLSILLFVNLKVLTKHYLG